MMIFSAIYQINKQNIYNIKKVSPLKKDIQTDNSININKKGNSTDKINKNKIFKLKKFYKKKEKINENHNKSRDEDNSQRKINAVSIFCREASIFSYFM